MDSKYRRVGDSIFRLQGICDPEKCGAWCCRNLQFVADPAESGDIEYYRSHGAEAAGRSDGRLDVIVPAVCRHLIPENKKCAIYEARPWICRCYAAKPSDRFSHPACGLRWVQVFGREAQQAASKLRKGD